MGRCILIKVPMELDQHYSCQWSCSINVASVHKKEDEKHFCQILQENKVCQAELHPILENPASFENCFKVENRKLHLPSS